MMSQQAIAKIELEEHYRNYLPRVSSKKAVQRLITHTSSKHLAGLKTIVLTNFGALNHDRRRGKTRSRKRKVALKNCRGLYHPKWKGEPPWIELFIDNIIPQDLPRVFVRIPLVVDMFIENTLFHEIGHHIHYAHKPEHKEEEDVADKWKEKLLRGYFRKRYWYAIPFLKVYVWIYGLIKKSRNKLR